MRVVPSLSHEALLLLFRNRPELAPELMRDALHVALPNYSEVRLESADLTDVVPTEYRADLVVLLVDGKPVLGIVVEVQLQRDDRKRFTWPVYVASLRARLQCAACVLVITPNERVAEWCRSPIDLGPGGALSPLVVGPAVVPVVDDPAIAARAPELAVLSVMAHGQEPHAEAIGRAALLAAMGLEEERQLLYSDVVYAALSEAARAALEGLMANGNYQYQSDFAKKHQAQGRAEGEAKGRADGRAEGLAAALLSLLDARGLPVSSAERELITSCADPARLDAWIRHAVTAKTTADALRAQ